MLLDNSQMYTMEVKDLNGTDVLTVTKLGWELLRDHSFLQVGQVINGWKMFIVVPFGV